MLGTSAVKQYFSTGDSHYVVPAVSAEWNYNLFYAPYATFAGDGTQISSNWKTPSSWTVSNCTASYDSSKGRVSNGYSDTSALKFSTTGQNGSGKLTITTTSGLNTYKIVFYAKIVTDVEVTLTALSYIDSHRSDSESKRIDNTTWTKFELYASSRPVDTSYSSFTLNLDFTSTDTTIASKVVGAPTTYDVLIDQLEIFQSTDFDYQYGNIWKTDAPFGFFRPGESYVPSGNSLTQLPSGFRTINTRFNKGSGSSYWDAQVMPCSPVLYHPQVLSSSAGNPVYKNGILSDYTTYKYFVSNTSSRSIGALYDKLMSTNKIVLKFNIAYSKPTSMTINLYNTITSYSKSISISGSDISNSGVCILYLQTNGNWTTTPWTTMPTFNNVGDITLSQAINKIAITQNSFSINSAYASPSSTITSNSTRYAQYQADMGRLQVIEISPRIELDLTNFVMNVETTSELDNKQNPLPISAISSNSALIHLSNIPFNVSGYVLSIFSNNSSKSPLSGLFKKNVKFYVNYIIKDSVSGATSADKVIPGGVWYAESWEGQDLQRTTVTAFDITKYLQLLSPTDYVSKSQDVFKVISNILDFAGFTDYDYDSLRKVTQSQVTMVDGTVYKNKQAIDSSFFYADGQQQKVFDVLRELFEVYQIGAYIDSYGVMKFLSLDNILSNTQPNLLLHDNSTPQSITTTGGYTDNLSVTSNITQDTYTEKVKTKLGKATLRFKIPQIVKTIGLEGLTSVKTLTTNLIDKYDVLWQAEKEDVCTFNYLNNSISSYSQNYFYINPDDLTNTFSSFGVDHAGYAIIEGEIVSFKDKEFKFNIGNLNVQDPAMTASFIDNDYRVIVSSSSDLSTAVSDFSARSGWGGVIHYAPTGKIANVERGLFNTPVRTHNLITNLNGSSTSGSSDTNSLYSKMIVTGGLNPSLNSNNHIQMNATTVGTYSILVAGSSEQSDSSHPYNTFSTKMHVGPSSGNPFHIGMGGGIVFGIRSGSNPIYVELRQENGGTKYIGSSLAATPAYRLYVYQGTESNSLLSKAGKGIPFVDISESLLNDIASYPAGSPFEEFGKSVHLKFVKIENPNTWIDSVTKQQIKSASFEIHLNKKKLNIETKDITINTSGQYGIFAQTKNQENSTAGSIAFSELYATQTALTDPAMWYHWQLPSFASTIAGGHKVFEINYMMQTKPQIFGINYYDIQYQTAPALSAYALPAPYRWYYYTGEGQKQTLEHVTVGSDALAYSQIYNSGFRGRFAIINGSPSSIWIKKFPDAVNPNLDVTFLINTNELVSLSSEVAIEKVFDPANINESIEIRSNWVQSKNAALGILKNIFRAVDGFSRDTTVSVYGNPLFEIGDVVKVNYSLKNISNQTYFVQGVQQSFDQGLKTVLTLNQIG